MEALVGQSIFLRSDCGGRGTCGKCAVKITAEDGSADTVTSCNYLVEKNISIEIPETSMLSSHVISKAPVSFPDSFIKRKAAAAGEDRYGIACDLGTTTIAIYLCNTVNGEILSSMAVKNPQALYGDDVMSRIGAVNQEENNLQRLQNLVVKAIEWGIANLLKNQSLEHDRLHSITVVGNPTMMHILAGVDPSSIGTFPYMPEFFDAITRSSAELGFGFNDIPLQLLPQISGFIGGDILSAALAVDFDSQPEGTLVIDLGTNGELLLKGKDKIYATSCATGPAFEGASLSCGTQAIPGAINRVSIDTRTEFCNYSIINPKNRSSLKPFGVCGTGVISAVAEFCRKLIIEPGGAFVKDQDITPLVADEAGKIRYLLVPEEATQDGGPVYISQKDIRSVQLGKAALITGIEFLLKAAGYEQAEKIIIAGAFGTHIEKEDMLTLGMIPEIDPEKIIIAGNSAGAGAVMVLSDSAYLEKSIAMAETIETVDLATDLKFQEVFVEKLSFPFMKN